MRLPGRLLFAKEIGLPAEVNEEQRTSQPGSTQHYRWEVLHALRIASPLQTTFASSKKSLPGRRDESAVALSIGLQSF